MKDRRNRNSEKERKEEEMKNWQIRSNAEVHGLSFAAKRHQEACRRQKKPSNFDAFYFAIFGKWPTPKGGKGKGE